MTRKRSNLIQFPFTRSRLYYWLTQYKSIREKNGDTIASNWLSKNAPEQLHRQIFEMYHKLKMQQSARKK